MKMSVGQGGMVVGRILFEQVQTVASSGQNMQKNMQIKMLRLTICNLQENIKTSEGGGGRVWITLTDRIDGSSTKAQGGSKPLKAK